MSFDDKKGFCFCQRCGHDWIAKPVGTEMREPRSCAKCKSKVWNQPRVYAGKYISGTLAKRFKPTGRAAARSKYNKQTLEPMTIDEIIEKMPPEEKDAAIKTVFIYKLTAMLDELGLR